MQYVADLQCTLKSNSCSSHANQKFSYQFFTETIESEIYIDLFSWCLFIQIIEFHQNRNLKCKYREQCIGFLISFTIQKPKYCLHFLLVVNCLSVLYNAHIIGLPYFHCAKEGQDL